MLSGRRHRKGWCRRPVLKLNVGRVIELQGGTEGEGEGEMSLQSRYCSARVDGHDLHLGGAAAAGGAKLLAEVALALRLGEGAPVAVRAPDGGEEVLSAVLV